MKHLKSSNLFEVKLRINSTTQSKSFFSDRGGEYLSQEFQDYVRSHEIISQLNPPLTPQLNGVSERRNRTLLDMVRSIMSKSSLPLSFWSYALFTATYILNMEPTKKVEKTPFEIWYEKAPYLS